MRKHFLLFMALFALVSVNKLFASGEASSHLTDGTLNPTTRELTALSLPVSISSITAENFATTVWAPATYNTTNLVTWSSDDAAIKFAAKEALGGVSDNNIEHPFIIRLAGAGKKVTVQANKAKSTVESNTGAGFKIYEWDGTKWVSKKEQGYTTSTVEANISASTRYVMIAPYGHGGGDRILSKLDITKVDPVLSPDKSALSFPLNDKSAQVITITNMYTTAMPSIAWKVATDKFTFTQTTQTGTADDGQTTISVSPAAGAVDGDNATLVVIAGSLSVEIPVSVKDNGVPFVIDSENKFNKFFSGQSNSKNQTNAQWNSSASAIELPRISGSYGDERYFELTFSGTPYQLSFGYKNDEGDQYAGGITMKVQESADGSSWTNVVTDVKPSNPADFKNFGPYDLSTTTKKIRVVMKGVDAQHLFKNLSIVSSSPTLSVTESSVELKANNATVYDNSIRFSVLKYASITAKIEGDGFGLVKGSADPASKITFTSADGLNDANFTNCEFKVRYSGNAESAIGQTATVKFYDGEDTQLGNAVSVSVVAVPVLTFEAATNGSYTYKYGSEDAVSVTEQKTRDLVAAPYDVTLSATPASGYKFFAWYMMNGEEKEYISTSATYTTSIETTKTIGAEFVDQIPMYFSIKNQDGVYLDLNDACAAALTSSSKIVVLANGGTLPKKTYTIPSGVTLLIPFDENYSYEYIDKPGMHTKHKRINGEDKNDYQYDRSTVYRMLTLSEGTVLNVEGVLSISAIRSVTINSGKSSDGKTQNIPNVSGDCRIDKYYGCITLGKQSEIVVNNGGKLYCWGRVRGDGSITAENGAEVRECFVYTDHRESDAYYTIGNAYKCFPINQYYVQEIQVPITYKYGSTGILVTGIYVNSGEYPYTGTTSFVGKDADKSFFALKSSTSSLTKSYSLSTDRLLFDIAGDADIRYFYIQGQKSLSSEKHVFSITNNWTLNINSGTTHIQKELSLSAGAELNIAKDAEVVIDEGVSFYVFDKQDWGEFACMRKIIPLFLPSYERNSGWYAENNIKVSNGYWGTTTTPYDAIRTHNNITNAIVKVNGTLTVTGGTNKIWNGNLRSGLYTTTNGAQITSDGNGQIRYLNASGSQTYIHSLYGAGQYSAAQGTNSPITPAQLKNADSTYTATAGFETATQFTYKNGHWVAEEIKAKTITIDNDKVTLVNEDDSETVTNVSTYTVENATMVEAETVTVSSGSTLNVEEGGAVVTTTLALTATPSDIDADNDKAGASSQITGGGSINATNVYIDIKMDPSGKLDDSKYYAFAVPFEVAISDGVEMISNDGVVMGNAAVETNYRAYSYNGATRAASGKTDDTWELVNGSFVPGKFYLIEFANSSCNIFRFHKAAQAALNNEGAIALAENTSSIADDAGWNGIANNSLHNTALSVENVTVAQVYDPSASAFISVPLSGEFALGTPMFIQTTGADAANLVPISTSAPKRMLAQTDDKTFGQYTVRIAAENASKLDDQLFICASENASEEYTIGKDLVKMFMGNATVAQLWVNAYDKKLSVNQAVLTDDVAEASLTLYAPKAGNYQVYLKNVPEDATLYLLEDGEAIANLNDGACVVSLSKGENKKFGLRINAVKTIPGVATSIDEALLGGKQANKVLVNGNVYIVRDSKLFNALGQQVK